jgi:PAS domain S-box-containing protein
LLATFSAAAAVPKHVLVVHSFGSAAPPFTTSSTAFESTLIAEMGEPVDLDEVSLDVARYATLDIEEALVELMRKRQARWQPDLVVPIGSPASIFVAQYRDRLFPATTPIVYTGMDQRRLPPGALQQNATFVGSSYDLPGMVEDILQLAPATTNIVVVIGATPLEQFWTDLLHREYERFTNRVSFTWFNDLSFDQMLERSAKLPSHSFMLLILLMRDASGVTHNADEALRRIHEVANAPVNGLFRNQLGMGIVGGRLYAEDAEGKESARIAIRILHGEAASSFPPRVTSPSQPQYDWRELQRWNIDEDRLPPGSIVQFREPTAWRRYWRPIAGIALFFLLQAFLIVSLLINRAKRRRGEAEAALIAEISSKFVNLPPGEVDHEIQEAQRRIFRLLDLDVSGFWQWSAEAAGFFRLTHYSRPGEGPQIPEQMNSQEYFPWYQQQVLAGRTIAVHSMTELPPEAVRDRETFRQFGFKSNLTIPLLVGGEPPVGALGFTTRVEREWPAALVKRLQLVAEIFANALARKRADQALRESEERMRMSQQAARVGMFDWNIKTGVNVWTPELEAMHGLPPGGFARTQRAWESLVHPTNRAEAEQKVELAFQTGEPVTGEWRVIWPDGSVHWLASRFQVFKDDAGAPVRMTGVNIDITERKRAQEELQESEARFRTVADTAPVLIWMSGPDKLCNFFNKGWLDFTGRPLAAELGNGWAEGVHPDDLPKCLKIYTESFDARRPFTMEYRLHRHDGGYRWISDHGVPRYDSAQVFLGYIGSCLDITERRQAEAEVLRQRAELAHVARVSTMGALAVSLAHELNQPLTAILSNAQAGSRFLAGPSDNVAEVREVLQDIAEDTKRAGDVIRQLRRLVKKDGIQLETLGVNQLIQDAVRLLHSDTVIRKVQIVLDFHGDLAPVRGDEVQLQQVMFNFLLNAFDAMKDVPEGERTVCVRTRQPDSGAIQIDVSDRGTGIRPEKLARLFEPFQTTKQEGLGLGLFISRSIVEAHGGRIWATNNADRGATFCFTLPLPSASENSA